MSEQRLSVTESAVLGLLAEGPSHGFALSKELDPESEVGRVFTVPRPLVYRALERLVEVGYVEAVTTEKGEGPRRIIHRITGAGRRRLDRWLMEPVGHVRDLRIEFLLKLTLTTRSGDSPIELIRNQQRALEPTLRALDDTGADDHIELWRQNNAAAAASYLEELAKIHE